MNFAEALTRVLEVEGGYSNDPEDKGGETFAGIARRFWPEWLGWALIDAGRDAGGVNMTPTLYTLVFEFYRIHFWNRVRGEELGELAYEVFELAVNTSVHTASILLQEALNLLNRNGTAWPELLVDGVLGPKTLAGVRAALREPNGQRHVLKLVNGLQLMHYVDLARRSPAQEKFLRGWLERT